MTGSDAPLTAADSGAEVAVPTDEGCWWARSDSGRSVGVSPTPDGPTLVRRADVVVSPDGVEHEVGRPVVAVCTCARSQRLPWCDSTHKSVRRR